MVGGRAKAKRLPFSPFPSLKPIGGASERPPKFPWGREQAASKEFRPSRVRASSAGANLAPI